MRNISLLITVLVISFLSAAAPVGAITDCAVSLPFTAVMQSFSFDAGRSAAVSSDALWCRASLADNTLTVSVTANNGDDSRTATLAVRDGKKPVQFVTVRQEARLRFAVISDTHVGNPCGAGYEIKVTQALRNLTRRGNLDALFVVGDLTEGGAAGQYEEFVEFFGSSDNILNPVENFFFMMGNHDNYADNAQQNYMDGLKKFSGNKSYPLHQYAIIKGYPFIALSDLGPATNDIGNSANADVSYPPESVATLERYLARAAEEAPGKPIFVFTHVPPSWTCYSTWYELENEAWAMKVLNPVLNKYPQAVVFGGHSHYPLGDPRSIHQGTNPHSPRNNYYTAINTASTTYSEINPGAVDAGIHPEGWDYVTEGMILEEQPDGGFEIRRYDTYRNVEIHSENRWVLKAPFDGSMFCYADVRDADDNPFNRVLRTGLPAPEFLKGAQLSLESAADGVKISFPQAADDECVFRYNVRVLKGDSVIKNSFIFSQFYLTTDMPRNLSCTVSELAPGTEYSVEVIALDSYDNPSEPLTATFTTL